MKFCHDLQDHRSGMSLPSRERGLKYPGGDRHLPEGRVAPFTGAWIEIFKGSSCPRSRAVAPFTGAWIEIAAEWSYQRYPTSLPSRERRLKYWGVVFDESHYLVAPFTGAWIEIQQDSQPYPTRWSLPSRERGLKSLRHRDDEQRIRSLPSRERGLKFMVNDHWRRVNGRSLHGSVD